MISRTPARYESGGDGYQLLLTGPIGHGHQVYRPPGAEINGAMPRNSETSGRSR